MKLGSYIKSRTRRFAGDEKGNVLVMFAATLAPLIMLIGTGVDYGRISKADAQLKATADAAVLAATQQYALDNRVDYREIVENYVADNLKEGTKPLFLEEVHVDGVEITEENEMKVDISANIPLYFSALLGPTHSHISGSAAAKVGGAKLEVALVLDNTGSMRGNKIAALKQAAQDLVRTLMPDNQDNEFVKMALVPFAEYVRLDESERNEPGLDIPDDYDNAISRVVSSCSGLEHCTCTGSKKSKVCKQEYTEHFQWYGCMGSRPYTPNRLNVLDESYGTQGAPGLMAEQDNCPNVKSLQRLSDKRADMINSIGNMNASGMTYIPSGLMWGWRVLSDVAPFTDGVEYSDKATKKVIVLMTDGENTVSMKKVTDNSVMHHEGDVYNHSGSSVSNANQMTTEACENIKQEGIMLFTIAFEVDSRSSVHTLLSNCAGNGGSYFDAQDSDELTAAFRSISLALNNLRLSQ
jgi:Mg-chelatase subunit ChlD